MPDLSIHQAMQTASEHYRAGRLAEAEKIYRQVLMQEPNHADAMHLLGALAGQMGQIDSAIELIGQAVRLRPEFPEAYGNLASALALKGRFDEAISALNQVIQLRPTDAGAYYTMGGALKMQGRLDEAIAAFSRAVELRPVFAEARTNLGDVLMSRGRFDEAILAHTTAIALRPDFSEAHANLANALKEKGLNNDAMGAYSRVDELRKIRNDSAVAQFNLAKALHGDGQLDEAAAAYGQAIDVKPDYIEAHQGLGLALYELKRFDEASTSFRRALDLAPDNVASHQALGLILLNKRDSAEAAADSFRRALAGSANLEGSWGGLGAALKSLGQFEEASSCFRRALELNPNNTDLYRSLASVGKQTVNADQINRIKELVNRPESSVDDRIAGEFALGKLFDEMDYFDEAFDHYASANLLIKQQRAAAGEYFDGDALRRQVDHLIETYTPQFYAQRKGWGEASESPVFIVGMPRSGTTLVEQIAASHPQVYGAGELKDISGISSTLGITNDNTRAKMWHPDTVKYLANIHMRRLATLGGRAARVTDKLPDNITNVGLIALLFPSTRIIFCRRDARDNCLSCFFQWFTDGGNVWCYDLADCGRRTLQIDRLIRHWQDALPLRMLEVQYEEMVADLEGQSRRLIDFLGLPWDPACLDFHKTERTVLTASAWQVRQPIYSSSVGRWRHYERHLGPLLDVLGRSE